MYNYFEFISKNRNSVKLDYLEYNEASTKGKRPLFIYIHGAGARGTDKTILKTLPIFKALDDGRECEGVFVAPQCHKDTWFELYDVLLEFIEYRINKGDVDTSRVYLTGSSMGGYTSWQVAMTHPEWFAAFAPICGGGMYWNAARLKGLPIWAFHGSVDPIVFPEESKKMVDAVNKNGGNARLTVFEGVGHDAWTNAFDMDELWAWFLSHKK